ncbi:Di-copper centre-containing protein, partial [Marasmius fiardii PR-910]
MSSRFVVTGAKGGQTQGAEAPNRLEINDFVKNDAQFSLYVQALQSIYSNKSQSDIDSFFQIGGIHGLPYVSWDGSGARAADRSGWEGYCTHGDVLFPTWHRPYMILIEQVIQTEAIKIAATYTGANAQQFKDAAQNLRQPYWDWARNSVPPAEVISLDNVTISAAPDGRKVQVTNPLRRYTFHPIDKSFTGPYNVWKTTVRYPTSTTKPNPTEDLNTMRKTLQRAQSQITSTTYNMLTRVNTWPAFSNHTVGDGGSGSNSLEAIHDGIHTTFGGGGHMSDPAVAAFDPIFFMHHANVDRLLSLWSALHPGVWVTRNTSQDGTWTIPVGTAIDKNTKLEPFWHTQQNYWTSAVVTTTSSLGYTYPEFNGLDTGNPSAVQTAIARIVNKLYGGTVRPRPRAFAATTAAVKTPKVEVKAHGSGASEEQAPLAATQSFISIHTSQHGNGGAHPEVAQAPHPVEDSRDLWEWTARIQVKKYEVGGSFSVPVFLGSVPENPAEWLTSDHFVGAHHAFVNSSAGHCGNCRTQQDLTLEGFVHLNDAIVNHAGLPSLDP